MDKQKLRYNIYYSRYNIIANAYIPYIKIVETNDIYHEIGKMVCSTLEKIVDIRYTQPKASREDCEKIFEERGYRKLGANLWIKEKYNG